VPVFSDALARLRAIFSPSEPKQPVRQNVREILETSASEEPSDPSGEAREPSEAPPPNDSSQGATLPELPSIPEEESDADRRAIPPG
jgi:hypothetical protein